MRIPFPLTAIALFALVTALPAQTGNSPLGIFEAQQDVGANPMPGAATFDAATGEYRVTGGGANIWAATDAFHFVWTRVTGNVDFSADVQFVGAGVVAHRKAVLMVRRDLTPDSQYADVALHGDGLTSLQFRTSAGGGTGEIRSSVNAPIHIRLVRFGNSFTAYAGRPGEELAATASQELNGLVDTVYVGLGVCSHDAGVLETAIFSNVRLNNLSGRIGPGSSMRNMNNPQPPHFRSKIAIYDLAAHSTRIVYQADQVIEAPNWSRDGKFLLINTEGHLYRLPLESAGEPKIEQISLGLGGYICNNDHDLSRDGKWLAFSASSVSSPKWVMLSSSGPASHQSQVYLAKANGSGAHLMTPAAPSYFHGWSPDGKWLAFVGQREGGAFHLYRVSAAGSAEQQLTTQGTYDDGPEYTPDSKWIYFNSNRSGSWRVWRMPTDGAGPGDAKAEQVTSDDWEDWFPHFSPDGKHLLVFSFPKGTTTHNDRMEGVALRLMRAPGNKLKPAKPEILLRFFGGQGTINVNSWSPDSRQFAFVEYEPIAAAGSAKP
jgi:Tol biopolymer transport system component